MRGMDQLKKRCYGDVSLMLYNNMIIKCQFDDCCFYSGAD
jgi:hypothetical protein